MASPSYHDIIGQADSLGPTVTAVAAAALGPMLTAPHVVFTGCGASYHAGAAAAGLLSALGPTTATAAPASDVWMNPEVWLRPGTLVVGLSRTGTTTETVAALAVARRYGAGTIGVSLTRDTPLLRDADGAIVLDHVGEQGRVMTRSFANLLLASQTLAVQAAEAHPDAPAYAEGLRTLPSAIGRAIDGFDATARAVAVPSTDHLVMLGSGPDVGVCRQAALQAQETAGIAVEAHAVLDFRHGPLALLHPESLVVLISNPRSVAADRIIADDLALLGGTLCVVGPARVVSGFGEHVTRVGTPDGLPMWLNGNAALPFLQLLAYHLTVVRGADPESVHNLDRTKQPHVNPHVLPDDLFGIDG